VSADEYIPRSFAEWDKDMEPVREAWRAAADAERMARENDPNNGTWGLWEVDGIRHNTVVDATSAPEALSKALESGEVGDWESPTVTFVKALTPPSEVTP
jgi:hypothetical protein